MITLTKPVRFNYRLAGDDGSRFDALAIGRRFSHATRDAAGAVCVEEWVGLDGKVRVHVPLGDGEFIEQKVLWT